MEKPPGWQEEQAVEIRRDWIAYLADGMGIDAPGATGAELEALVVRRMLEQAVRAYSHACICFPSARQSSEYGGVMLGNERECFMFSFVFLVDE